MIGSWLGWELRRHWRSLAALLLLTAIAVAAIGAATAGGFRALSAQERLDAITRPATIAVLPNQPGFDWAAVERLPQVAGDSKFAVADVWLNGVDSFGAFPTVGPGATTQAEKMVVLAGRRLDPTNEHEVMASPNFLTFTHKKIGDTVTVDLYKAKTINKAYSSPIDLKPDGPKISATIVGVGRSEWYNDIQGAQGGLLLSPALFATHRANFLGDPEVAYVNALVRLKHGAADIPAFTAALARVTGRSDIDIWNLKDKNIAIGNFISFEAWCLLALAGAAAIASLFLIGQTVARAAASGIGELDPLRQIGLDDRAALRAAVLPLVIPIALGAVLGGAAAVALSALFPIGTAAYYEPTPGFSFQPAVEGTVVVVAILLLLVIAVTTCLFALRGQRDRAGGSAVAATAARIGLPVSVVLGTRFALEPGRGRRAIPVRPALIGAIVGVTGVVGALTFSFGISDAATNPARFGHTYSLEAYTGFQDITAEDPAKLAKLIRSQPGVLGVNDTQFSVADVLNRKDLTVTLGTYTPFGDTAFVATEGRLPESGTEVALGPSTARLMGAVIGDRLKLKGSAGEATMTVVGLAFTPDSSHSGYDDAGFVTADAHQKLWGDEFKFRTMQVWTAPGTHLGALSKKITAGTAKTSIDGPLYFAPPMPPEQVGLLQRVVILPQVLAGFLLLLAIASLGHALITALRRRRHDIAITRSLGQTPGQARVVSTTQATVVALVGVLIGVPLGLALGRTIWRLVATQTPVQFADPTSALLVLVTLAAAILIANALAVWPGHRAARLRVAEVLRAE